MEKKFSELEEGVDYIDLSKHEYDDPNLDSDDYDARGPRWLVCAHYGNDKHNNPTYGGLAYDEWVVCESLEEALEVYAKFCELENLRIASIAAVVRSTDYEKVSTLEYSQAKLFLAGTPE